MALDHDLGRSCACGDFRVTKKVAGLGNEATACVRSIASSLTKKKLPASESGLAKTGSAAPRATSM